MSEQLKQIERHFEDGMYETLPTDREIVTRCHVIQAGLTKHIKCLQPSTLQQTFRNPAIDLKPAQKQV